VQTQSHTSFAKLLVCAVLALCVAAPAALADAPAFPSAVPSQPGALTGPDSTSNAARAQERYYSSYGTPAPLSQPSNPVDDGGIDWSAIGIAIGGAFLIVGVPMAVLMRTRRRTARVRVAA
jgi:opacity protein-like surface antigen